MMQLFFLCTVLCAMNTYALFTYDTAASLMEQGKWDEAKQKLHNLLIDSPDAPDLLYDAGIASYKTKEYAQACTYFKRAAQSSQANMQLKEQAYFNAGNAAVALQEYEDALKQYQEVLTINPHNEKAKANSARVKELMQRKQEKKNQDEKNQKENQQKDKQQKEDASSNAEQQDDNKKEEQQGAQEQKQEKKDMSQDSPNQNQQEKGDKEQQGAHADKDNAREDNDSSHGQDAHEQNKEQKRHEQSPEVKNKSQQAQGTGAQEKDQGKQGDQAYGEQSNALQKLDARLVQVLETQEKKDSAINRRMINAAVGQSMGGKQGENCW